jgi:hypothetical protein
MAKTAILSSLLALALAGPALAEPRPLVCGAHRITVAHVEGYYLACHLTFGRLAHVQTVSCAPRRMKITDGRLLVNGMGEVTGWFDVVEKRKTVRADVRGYLSFTGQMTLGLQKEGDPLVHALAGTGRVKPTCAPGPTVFSEDYDDE